MIFLTRWTLPCGLVWGGPEIEADSWEAAVQEADSLGLTIDGIFEGAYPVYEVPEKYTVFPFLLIPVSVQ